MREIFRDRSGLLGRARIQLWRATEKGENPLWYPGESTLVLEQEQRVSNLITDVGLAWIADQLSAAPALAALSHMELGTDGTPPQATNTTLGTPIAGSRKALTTSVLQSGNKITWATFWDLGEVVNPSVSEAGDFNAAAVGDMIGRIAIGPFDVTSEHVLLIEREVAFVRGE